jgi:anthranilate phosphoribosyltransferase
MKEMGIKHGLVVSAVDNGMDEISVSGETAVSEISEDGVRDYIITPEQFGIKRSAPEEVRGGNAEENVKYTLDILKGVKGAKRDIVVLNAGAAIYSAKRASSIAEGVKMAEKAIDDGSALRKLEELKKLSNEV